ncbi:gephyrin-like [Tropilaelaps mercedesae]|uniref:Gephyrin-like n=1 Tax=Tropilaelaps mercedesae TaxID=418985 RepID=A0A1V9XUR4_9ACAR|nr:gephyrin-like [Tropilaelaps mercedesae]
MASVRISVLTVSDRCSWGEAEDRSGPELISLLGEIFPGNDASAIKKTIVPDDVLRIQETIIDWCSTGMDLIVSTGGTGFSLRDVTPEAVTPLLDRRADAMAAVLVNQGMANTPLALLSRPVCGVRGRTLIITLPGSVKAVRECFNVLRPALPHAIRLLREERTKHNAVHCNCSESAAKTNEEGDVNPKHFSESIVGRARTSPYPMVEKNKAIQIAVELLQGKTKVEDEVVSPYEAFGRICTKDVVATKPFPPCRMAIKDGYAVRCQGSLSPRVRAYAATAGALPAQIISESSSSSDDYKLKNTADDVVNEEWCVRISTGGLVPEGADAVVQVEDTKLTEMNLTNDMELRINILKRPIPGQDIRPIGCDIPVGSLLLAKGHRIDAAAIGTLVMAGVKVVPVTRLPVVGVLSTGSELIQEHLECAAEHKGVQCQGHIPDSNRPMLLALLKQIGVPVVDLGIAKDIRHELESKLREAHLCDIIVTSGGVSMGEKDLLKHVLTHLGYTVHFGRVNVKPGKPTTLASDKQGRMVFALPGNPASAFVMFQIFVRAALRALGADKPVRRSKAKLRIATYLELDRRPEFLRGILSVNANDQCLEVRPSSMQQSSSLLSFRDADVLIELPGRTSDRTIMIDGSVVDVIWI